MTDKEIHRRDFFSMLLHKAALAALAILGAVLVCKKRDPALRQVCENQGICRGCSRFVDCGLPQALSAKEILTKR